MSCSTIPSGCKIIISGYFCTGKTSVMELLQQNYSLKKPKDYTTRSMRSNEREGFPYSFISEEKFLELERIGKLFDPIMHAGNRYASDREALFSDGPWVMDILPDSWPVYSQIPGVIGIYLIPPSHDILNERAIKRGDSLESINRRIEAITLQDPKLYDFAVEPQKSLQDLYGRIISIISGK